MQELIVAIFTILECKKKGKEQDKCLWRWRSKNTRASSRRIWKENYWKTKRKIKRKKKGIKDKKKKKGKNNWNNKKKLSKKLRNTISLLTMDPFLNRSKSSMKTKINSKMISRTIKKSKILKVNKVNIKNKLKSRN